MTRRWAEVVTSVLALGLAAGCGGRETETRAPDDPEPAVGVELGPIDAPRLTARANRTCHVLEDGRVRCWGAVLEQTGPSRSGSVEDALQVAVGRTAQCVLHRTHRVTCEGERVGATAEQLEALGSVAMLTGGDEHFCALREGGDVHCWGSLFSLGRRGESDGPVVIEGLPPSRQIAASSEHTCALARDGSVHCWGRGFFGGLGSGGAPDSAAPVRVPGIDDAIRIDASYDVSCAIGQSGALSCWGRGPVRGSEDAAAVTRIASVEGAVDVDVNDVSVCVVDAGGAVRCGDHEGLSAVEGVSDAIEVELGRGHGCTRAADDTVRCWGARDEGQLGEAVPNAALPSPRPTATGIARIQGGEHLVLFGRDGSVVVSEFERLVPLEAARGADGYARGPRESCWWREGAVSCVHTAMGTDWSHSEPTPHPELGEVLELAFWRGGGCARAAGGTVTCWRIPPFMGPGDVPAPPDVDPTPTAWRGPGHPVPEYRPRPVRALRGVTQLVGTDDMLVGLTPAGVRVGLERMSTLSGLRGASSLVAEQQRTCALRRGRVACWHEEDEPIAPVFVEGVEGATQVSVSGGHACARLESGRAMCWGSNDFGALGDGTTEERDGAVVVGGAAPTLGVVAVAAVDESSCVLLEDDTVRCFGQEDFVPPDPPATSAVLVPTLSL